MMVLATLLLEAAYGMTIWGDPRVGIGIPLNLEAFPFSSW